MSRIFEALQKSEAQRPGAGATNPALPQTEVLATGRVFTEVADFKPAHIAMAPESRLVCLTHRDGLGAEKFRFLGVRLRQMQPSRSLKRVLITSMIPEEGKSLVSSNLAITLARKRQQRVLLVDGDMRRPVLAGLFGL